MTRLPFYFTYLNRLKNEEVTFSIRGQDHTEDEPGTAGPPLKRLPLPLQLDPAPPLSFSSFTQSVLVKPNRPCYGQHHVQSISASIRDDHFSACWFEYQYVEKVMVRPSSSSCYDAPVHLNS